MPEFIDNTQLLADSHRLIGTAKEFLEKLDRDVDTTEPAKAETVAMIHLIIETQSDVIRKLVEQQLQICDKLNDFVAANPDM